MQRKWFLALLIFLGAWLGRPSQAYYSVLDTAEILSLGQFDASLETEFLTANGHGANLVGRFDVPVSVESQLRGLIGFGTTDFHLGGAYKWVPVPDVESQPGMGVIGEVLYARAPNSVGRMDDFLTIRVIPVISKAYHQDWGTLTPFASLPIGVSMGEFSNSPVQIAFGADVRTPQIQCAHWRAEIGFNLHDAYSYISLNAVLDIDAQRGVQFR